MSSIRKWLMLVILSSGTLLVNLDKSFIGVILPTVSLDLQIQLQTTQWVATIYLITVSTLLPITGYLADIIGRKRFFVAGMLLFASGSLLASQSTSINQLLLARTIQGTGAAAFLCNIMATVVNIFEINEQGRAIGLITAVVAVGNVLGPPVAGFMTDSFGWRSVFLISFLVPLLSVVLAARILEGSNDPEKNNKVDLWGPICLGSAIGLTVTYFSTLSSNRDAWPILPAVFVLLVVFNYKGKRSKAPFLSPELFLSKGFLLGNVVSVSINVLWFIFIISIPYFMQIYLGLSATLTGVYMVLLPLGMVVMSLFGGVLNDKIGSYKAMFAGFIVITFSFVLMAVTVDRYFICILISMVLFGIGRGIANPANQTFLMQSVPSSKASSTNGFVASLRNVGNGFGGNDCHHYTHAAARCGPSQ